MDSGLPRSGEELVFAPLGGVGEIGMNFALYGYGPPRARTWIAVDFGIAFAHEDMPGADVIFPDIAFLEEERTNLAGILITHAHEDHYGALLELWPRLRVPVYATAFTAGLLNAKRAAEIGTEVVPVTVVAPGGRFTVGPFDVEYINVAHSIPEANALAIRTPLGTVLHSGDWKLDDTPVIGQPTDAERLKAIGEEGVLALVCDFDQRLSRRPQPERAGGRPRDRGDRQAGEGEGRLHDLLLQCRADPVHRAGGGQCRAGSGGRRPRHPPGARRGRRTRHARRHAALSRGGGVRPPAA